MKFHPILFSTEMVKAEQADLKNQTRRTRGLEKINNSPDEWKFSKLAINRKGEFEAMFKYVLDGTLVNIKCPYGQPGDVLWVRESYCPKYFENWLDAYKADFNSTMEEYVPEPKWKPSIHMPKAACRIFLQIKNIRVERLQDISEDDAKAEGAEKVWQDTNGIFWYPASESIRSVGEHGDYRTGFKSIWVRINGLESWNANPWVWVIEFERIEKPEKFG